jgi:hypothetical protein
VGRLDPKGPLYSHRTAARVDTYTAQPADCACMNVFVQSTVIAISLGACGGGATDATTADGKAGVAKAGDGAKADDGNVPPEVARKLEEGTRALASVGKDQRAMLAAAALAEAEVGRLPTELIDALGEMSRVSPDMHTLVAIRAIATPALLAPLEELCDGRGAETLSQVAQVAPSEKIALVWSGCKLERAGLVTRAEADSAEIGQLMLGHVALRVLTTKGGPSEAERELLRAFVVGSAGRGPRP